eukprot:TRINITY_DN9477_c0_g1_i1.p3 TRINITY_DN9477_c0_g1~~TRINITY_DN9477_c0_g1_i1.p3  ORF type:complete len:72 (+),score=10.33 TRINITY_DN9477_c0_g1_i1:384-599(+)
MFTPFVTKSRFCAEGFFSSHSPSFWGDESVEFVISGFCSLVVWILEACWVWNKFFGDFGDVRCENVLQYTL